MDERFKPIQERLKKKVSEARERRERQSKFTPPRYDEVYFEGVARLDAIARGEIEG